MDYHIRGVYLHKGRIGFFAGMLSQFADGTVVADIKDYCSQDRDQGLIGEIRSDGSAAALAFFKRTNSPDLSDILYVVRKNAPGIEGTFTGRWNALGYKVEGEDSQSLRRGPDRGLAGRAMQRSAGGYAAVAVTRIE